MLRGQGTIVSAAFLSHDVCFLIQCLPTETAQPAWPSPAKFMTRNKLLRRRKKTVSINLGKACSQHCRAGPKLPERGAQQSCWGWKGGGGAWLRGRAQQPDKAGAWSGRHKDLAFPQTIRKRRGLEQGEALTALCGLSRSCLLLTIPVPSWGPLSPEFTRCRLRETVTLSLAYQRVFAGAGSLV